MHIKKDSLPEAGGPGMSKDARREEVGIMSLGLKPPTSANSVLAIICATHLIVVPRVVLSLKCD